MNIKLSPALTKAQVFETIKLFLENVHFEIIDSDKNRPWGGFYVIDESQSQKFIDYFFNDVPDEDKKSVGKISPKILIVERGKRLSWQYHHRRAELWKVIGGEAGIITSESDKENDVQTKHPGDVVKLKQGERHRLIGLNNWGIIAEIWKHTDTDHPSDENDIVRVQDDFGR
jgi:mannose-6-phosphate isomerase